MATKKQKSAKEASEQSPKPRNSKLPHFRSFRLSRQKRHTQKLPAAHTLLINALRLLGRNWKLFLGITAIYGILFVLFVDTSVTDISGAKESLKDVFVGKSGELTASITLFGYLVNSSGSVSNDVAAVYRAMLLTLMSLSVIWVLRHVYNKQKVSIRDSFYKSTFPLIPFVIVITVISLQLIPFLVGSALFSIVNESGVAAQSMEKLLWGLVYFGLAIVSMYMLSSSVFALYIVTLPNMTPIKALKSARKIVMFRRFSVLRKLLFLPLSLLLIAGIIMVPIIMLAPILAEWTFFGLSLLALPVFHGYIYSLYRELV